MNKPQIFAVIIITGTVLYFLKDAAAHLEALYESNVRLPKRSLRRDLNNGSNKSSIFHSCCLQISYARQATPLHRILLSRQNRVADPVYEGEEAGLAFSICDDFLTRCQ